MQALIKRFVWAECGITGYGLIAAVLILIGIAAWVVPTAPRVAAASTQIGVDPFEMTAHAKHLPTSHYSSF